MNTSRSEQLYKTACGFMPGGVNSPVRACKAVGTVPLFIDHAKGSRIWDEADKLKKEYHDKIKTAKTEADQILADAKERADEAYNSQMEDIRVETERLKEKAKKDIEAQHEKAMQATQAEIAKLAVVAARKILETGDSRDADSSK